MRTFVSRPISCNFGNRCRRAKPHRWTFWCAGQAGNDPDAPGLRSLLWGFQVQHQIAGRAMQSPAGPWKLNQQLVYADVYADIDLESNWWLMVRYETMRIWFDQVRPGLSTCPSVDLRWSSLVPSCTFAFHLLITVRSTWSNCLIWAWRDS